MAQIISVRLVWDHGSGNGVVDQFINRRFYTLNVDPTDTHPFGEKGKALANAWKQLSDPTVSGMLIMDSDVAIDPHDHNVMLRAIDAEPDIIHVAPVKIWPVSTKRPDWVWCHWVTEPSQTIEDNPLWFSFNFTYIPRKLMEKAIQNGMKSWAYPGVDKMMAETAQKSGIKVNVVRNCQPKHLNY